MTYDDSNETAMRLLRMAAARYFLARLPSSERPFVANQALDLGTYSSKLAEVALDQQPLMSEVGPLFERAVARDERTLGGFRLRVCDVDGLPLIDDRADGSLPWPRPAEAQVQLVAGEYDFDLWSVDYEPSGGRHCIDAGSTLEFDLHPIRR